jgi:hypothetical protein
MARLEVSGSCYCGAVRFTARFPTRFVAHCHCRNCQRAHGAPMVTWAGVVDERFRLESGEAELIAYATDTGATRSFCRVCGTTLFYRSPRWPGEVHVAAVNFDGPLDREPQAHVYADRAPSWCPMREGLPRLGGESGTEPL